MDQPVIIFARDDISQPYGEQEISFLTRRRGGGGGGGRGGGGSSSSGGSRSSSSGSSSSGISSSSGSSSGSRSSGSTVGSSSGGSTAANKGFTPGSVSGGRSVYGSSAGQGIPGRYGVTSGAFAGRQAGGGQRGNVFGSPYYGSGYTSGYAGRGALAGGAVAGLGFPFVFWPLAFGGGYAGYYGSREYNNDNDRPGGAQTQYVLNPPASVTNATANQFVLYGDANSVDSVYQAVKGTCGVGDTLAQNFTITPNQAVQYYRGSSFAILLNGYNNNQPNVTTDASGNSTQYDVTATAPPLTSVPGVDINYFNCLNQTTGSNVPLLQDTNGAMSALMASNNVAILLPVVLMAMLMNVIG